MHHYEIVSGTDLFFIPEAEFESVCRQYLSVSWDTLRSIPEYSPTRQGYYFLGWQTGYYSVVPRLPVPEVVDAWENSDGTITLQVDALFSWYGTDRAFSHTVTVEPRSDGSFRYVSNTVAEVETNIFPKRELSSRRAAMIDRISP